MKKISLIFLIIYFGCSTPEKEIVEISPEYFVDEQLSLSDIANDIEYIPLDSKILIPGFMSIEMTDSLIIIAGTRGAGVLEYDKSGSFIRKIGRVGKGPGEYLIPRSTIFDEKTREMYVSTSSKLLVYDYEGNLLRTTPVNSDLEKMTTTLLKDDKLYWFSNISTGTRDTTPYYWTVTDKKCNELHSKRNTTTGFRPSRQSLSVRANFAYRYKDRLCYWNHYNDTIFELLGDSSYKARYLFKQDRYRLTPEVVSTPNYFPGLDQHYVPNFITESQHYLFISYRQDRQPYLCLYDKAEKKFKRVLLDNKKGGLNNDLDAGLPFIFYYSMYVDPSNNEYLVYYVNPFELKAQVASESFKNSTPKYPEKKKELEKLANSLNENDNPVLMLVKLKN